ncbi:MAG: hypothetical protein GY789_23960 [Hyphomicrobiales bacterium]|nr:hypothetical protein [Hyphomicrobiales bacterium]MCP5001458.1 hypothetical protein [Hyphomicrobiales bacterium]
MTASETEEQGIGRRRSDARSILRKRSVVHSCDIHKTARQCGVRLYNGARQYHTKRCARECFSPATLRRIGRAHGAAHLAIVLRLIVETEGNARELYAETLSAISSLLEHEPALIERGVALFDAFDDIDLAEIHERAQVMPCGLPVGHVMRILLLQELSQTRPLRST